MVDPPTYRVDPDPQFADRLERVLLQQLTAKPDRTSSSRDVVQSDEPVRIGAEPNHREGDIIMLDTQDPPAGPAAPRRGSPGRWLLVAAAVALVAIVGTVLVAVGGDDEKPLQTVTPPTVAPPDNSCPFIADEVSAIIGETVIGPESATVCGFGLAPEPGQSVASAFPSVYFDYLPASACTPESRSEADGGPYSDAVDGLGVDAYSSRVSLGVSLLVCNGDQPFAVLADGIQGGSLAAAVALARLVLDR